MKRIFAAALCVAALAGCASGSLIGGGGDPSVADRYAAARLDFNAALVSLLAYAQRPPCSPTIVVACAKQGVIDRAYLAAQTVDASLDAAGVAIDGDDGEAARVALNAAVVALAGLQSILVAELQGSST